MREDSLLTPQEMADLAHRLKCLVDRNGNRACICEMYAYVTGCLHPDCPEHGYAPRVRTEAANGGE